MAFQDFDQIQERRNAEKQRKLRKTLIIVFVTLLLVVLAVGAVFAFFAAQKHDQPKPASADATVNVDTANDEKATAANDDKPAAIQPDILGGSSISDFLPPVTETLKNLGTDKIVKTVCNSTRYIEECEQTLNKVAANSGSSSPTPKSLLESTIAAIEEEINKVTENTAALKFNTPEEEKAAEYCKGLIGDAKEELLQAIGQVKDTELESFAKITPDLNNWLSAVMSYQESCVDGFPEGSVRSEVQKTLNASQIQASNSLAMIKSFTSYADSLSPAYEISRYLLDSKELPTWMSHGDRRMLKAVDLASLNPNITVAQDGSGNFTTINAALNAMPAKYEGRYIIYIKTGVYNEIVTVDKKKANLTMVGEGSKKTIITGNRSNATNFRTFETPCFVAQGESFMAQSMGFRNTAGAEGHQAVAARVTADKAIFVNCLFEGYQDTLYAHAHRQYYRSCVIKGTVDFIFGDAAAMFQNCMLFLRKGLPNQQNLVTAQGRIDPFQTTGFVFQNCTVVADDDLKPVKANYKSYLGRPWKRYSRTVFMESTITDSIEPEGWMKWQNSDFALDTLFYAEYNNDGASGKPETRVNWPGFKVLTKEQALEFTVGPFLQGGWINATGSPVKFGMYDDA